MSVTSGFFDSNSGDRKYNTDQLSRIFDGIIKDGVYMGYEDALIVKATSPASLSVNVSSGRAWFNHTWTRNDAELPITIDPGDVVLDRIDSIILDVNSNVDVRKNDIIYVKGTPSSNPVHPTLIKEEKHKQYPLCDISMPAGSKTITQAQITNRIGTSDCPFVTGIIETIDADELLAQWDAEYKEWYRNVQNEIDSWSKQEKADFETWISQQEKDFDSWSKQEKADFETWSKEEEDIFNSWSNSRKEEFLAWFSSLETVLDGDIAGNLLNRINHRTGVNAVAIYNEGVIQITAPEDSGEIITFVAPTDFFNGDTYTVNGIPVDLMDLNGEPIEYAWKTGALVQLMIQNGKAFFKSGGGVNQTLPLLLPNFKAYWYDDQTVIVIADMVPAAENPNLAGAKFVYSKDGLAFPNNPVDGISVDIPIDELVY